MYIFPSLPIYMYAHISILNALFFSASADNKVPQPSRTKATTPRASKAPVTITTTTVTPQAAPQRGIPRRISPHRLPSRRKTPKLASATTTTTTETAASDIEPPQLPEELVAQLSSADEASDPSDAAEEEVTTKNPLARFALLPRRRPSRIRVSGKPKAPGQGIARPSKTNTAATTTTTTELNPTVAGNTGISRPRNGRFGGSRLRPGAGNRRTESAAPASSAAAVTSTVPATPGRIQLPERRSRFTNARVPPRATHSVDTTVAVTQPENSSPDAVPAVEDQTSVVSRRRNGRRFPSLTRRTS